MFLSMTDLITEISEQVRRERKRLGLTQQQLADLAGVSIGFLQALESAKPTLHFEKVIRVVETVGLELELKPRADGAHRPTTETSGS